MDSFVYDTNDLNTIRGGGLLLLQAPETETEKILHDYVKCKRVQPISKGASWGLFEFEAERDEDAVSVRNTVQHYFANHRDFRHATFVVDVLRAPVRDDRFVAVRDALHALNRWRQMRSPSIAVPKPADDVCAVDQLRPASEKEFIGDEKVMVSASVKNRREFGKEQKKDDFYIRLTKLNDLKFTQHLTELSSDPCKGILHHKIALIYIDGNDFGSIQKKHCRTKKRQQKFDQDLREGQRQVLKKLLKTANKEDSGKWKNGQKIRLETLLWGGDEIIWVVPAWLGWTTLSLFYEQAQKRIRFNGPLSHAAGLVFCHHNAPIYRVKKLAEDLAKLAKQKNKKENWFAYQVLESFDHLGTDLEQQRAKHAENITTADGLLVAAEKMEPIAKVFRELKDGDFPKRKLYQILKTLREGDRKKSDEYIKKVSEQPEFEPALLQLDALFNNREPYAKWLHLMDLWDYIPTERDRHDAN